jgi:hypothetical protein
VNNKMTFRSYYKMPAAQTSLENCVAHNGSLIPIPGRDIMVQGLVPGGISIFDWTDIDHPGRSPSTIADRWTRCAWCPPGHGPCTGTTA